MMKRLSVLCFSLSLLILCPAPSADGASSDALDDLTSLTRAQERKADEEDDNGTAYLIGAQNLLQIKIFGESSVTPIYRVEEDGYIKHALIGRVKLGGLTTTEAERVMEEKLDGDYIINPQVNILVLEYSRFSIIGEIRKPGNYEISGRMSVIRAISTAGGFTPIANQRDVQIIRKNTDGTERKIGVDTTRITRGDLSAEVDLQADDVIIVGKSFF